MSEKSQKWLYNSGGKDMDIRVKAQYNLENMEHTRAIEECDEILKSELRYYDDRGQLKENEENMIVASITGTEIEMTFMDDDRRKPLTIPIEKLSGWTAVPSYFLVNKETGEKAVPGSFTSSSLLLLVYHDEDDNIKAVTNIEVIEATATEVTFCKEDYEEFTLPADRIIDWKTEEYYYRHEQQQEQGDKNLIPVTEKKDGRTEKNIPADTAKPSLIASLHQKQIQLNDQQVSIQGLPRSKELSK